MTWKHQKYGSPPEIAASKNIPIIIITNTTNPTNDDDLLVFLLTFLHHLPPSLHSPWVPSSSSSSSSRLPPHLTPPPPSPAAIWLSRGCPSDPPTPVFRNSCPCDWPPPHMIHAYEEEASRRSGAGSAVVAGLLGTRGADAARCPGLREATRGQAARAARH